MPMVQYYKFHTTAVHKPALLYSVILRRERENLHLWPRGALFYPWRSQVRAYVTLSRIAETNTESPARREPFGDTGP
jgi:hypothetical protein